MGSSPSDAVVVRVSREESAMQSGESSVYDPDTDDTIGLGWPMFSCRYVWLLVIPVADWRELPPGQRLPFDSAPGGGGTRTAQSPGAQCKQRQQREVLPQAGPFRLACAGLNPGFAQHAEALAMPPAPVLHPQGEQDLFARIYLFAETARRREAFAGCGHVASGREVQPPTVNGPGPIASAGSRLRPRIGVSSRP
jgi:hypothetical protein